MKPHIRFRRGVWLAEMRVRLPEGIAWPYDGIGPNVRVCQGPCFFCVCRTLEKLQVCGMVP